jgi:hypothetical protein
LGQRAILIVGKSTNRAVPEPSRGRFGYEEFRRCVHYSRVLYSRRIHYSPACKCSTLISRRILLKRDKLFDEYLDTLSPDRD